MDDASRNSMNPPGKLIAVAFGYLAITIVMTYPMAFHMGEHYSIHNDYFQGLWNFWWFKTALIEWGKNPYTTDYLFFPTGVSLAFHTLSVTNAALALPLLYVVDVITAYNVVYLLTFVLAGLGSYLLVHDLTGDRRAAFMSGLILAFCPYHFVKSYQIWAASIEWIPLFAFFFLRFLRGGGLKEASWSAIMLFFASLSSWYLMVFLFLFAAFSLSYYLAVKDRSLLTMGFIKDLSFAAGLYGLLILPFAYPMIREVIQGETNMYTSLYAQFLKGGHVLEGGRTGSTFQVGMTQLFGLRLAGPISWPGVMGYLALLLALFGALKGKMKEKGLWIASTLVFFLFLLGPYLTVFDHVYHNIPLPWLILDRLPIFRAVRYPHRFLAPVMACVAVLAGSGGTVIAGWIARWRVWGGRRPVGPVFILLYVLILGEYFTAPIGHYTVHMSPFYNRLAADGRGDYAILEVPVMTPFTTRYMFYQTIHGKRIVGGQVVHPKEEVIDFLKTTPVIKELANPVLSEERGEEITLPSNAEEILRGLGIRYVIVHVGLLRPYTEVNPAKGSVGRGLLHSLLPPFMAPQRDLLQEEFYFTMRKKTAFEDGRYLKELIDELERTLGPPVFSDDSIMAFEVKG